MKLKLLVQALLFLTVAIILSQLLLLIFLTRDPHFYNDDYPSVKALKILNEFAETKNMQLFILDSDVMSSLPKTLFPVTEEPNHCQILCNQNIIHLGIYRDLFGKNNFLDEIVGSGIVTTKFFSSCPHALSSMCEDNAIITHILLSYKKQFIVDVAITYDIDDNMTWIGSILRDENYVTKLKEAGISGNLVISYDVLLPRVPYYVFNLDGLKLLFPHNIKKVTSYLKKKYLECNQTVVQQFESKFGSQRSPREVNFRHKALKALTAAKQILHRLGIPFWLSSGTSLGYYRQCDIIPYTTDVDIGIFAEDFDDRMTSTFLERGFKLKHSFGKLNDSYELSYVLDGVKLDIFFFYKEGKFIWNGGTQARTGKKFKYIFHKFDLCWTHFLDLLVNVPCPMEQYLIDNYGEDWFSPIKEWDWKTSPANVIENGVWDTEEWPRVIQVYDV